MLEPIPEPALPTARTALFARDLPTGAAIQWLQAGWTDFRHNPAKSTTHGVALVLVSYGLIAALYQAGLLYLLLPAFAGFLIVSPFLAVGLLNLSWRKEDPSVAGLARQLIQRPGFARELAYLGLLLCLLVLFWLRAADLLYALFYGLHPFPGALSALYNVLFTPHGWVLLMTGSVAGGLFAAFALAVSAFSFPLLMTQSKDALTAIGMSFAMTTQNLRPVLAWGGIVTLGLVISLATGLTALIVVFPVLGHGSWHMFRAIHSER